MFKKVITACYKRVVFSLVWWAIHNLMLIKLVKYLSFAMYNKFYFSKLVLIAIHTAARASRTVVTPDGWLMVSLTMMCEGKMFFNHMDESWSGIYWLEKKALFCDLNVLKYHLTGFPSFRFNLFKPISRRVCFLNHISIPPSLLQTSTTVSITLSISLSNSSLRKVINSLLSGCPRCQPQRARTSTEAVNKPCCQMQPTPDTHTRNLVNICI